ncbi:hypothetical protein CEXT_605341 [Caerostris extrusa]|uniref:Uncharacterized protein n=1 Tax=Caerostris extrusa TaxID=172846 RepID=A0AAV4TUJ5_CAEEX|nr:hypothetical protein CEXT_605341 [Caerostris extrusa]
MMDQMLNQCFEKGATADAGQLQLAGQHSGGRPAADGVLGERPQQFQGRTSQRVHLLQRLRAHLHQSQLRGHHGHFLRHFLGWPTGKHLSPPRGPGSQPVGQSSGAGDQCGDHGRPALPAWIQLHRVQLPRDAHFRNQAAQPEPDAAAGGFAGRPAGARGEHAGPQPPGETGEGHHHFRGPEGDLHPGHVQLRCLDTRGLLCRCNFH